MSDRFTIIGAKGFIGRHLVLHLETTGAPVMAVDRVAGGLPHALGHVIDCGGLTADFRVRRAELFEAHASRVDRFLESARFASYLYLSSTRLYKSRAETHEHAALEVSPAEFDDSYNISKIAGESICLMAENPAVRVARLSNVIGANRDPSIFLTSLIETALATGRIVLEESMASAKDYIDVRDVCRYLELIATRGRHRLYNVAYGENRSHGEILDRLSKHIEFSVEAPPAPRRAFPPIATGRLRAEFGAPQHSPEAALDAIVPMFKTRDAPQRSRAETS